MWFSLSPNKHTAKTPAPRAGVFASLLQENIFLFKERLFCSRRGFSVQGEVFLFKERFSLLVGELFASVFQGDILACLTK